MSELNRQWLLAARPHGLVKESDFEYRESPIPEIADDEVLVRNLYLSFDPAMRGWMQDRKSYLPPVAIGEPMRASCVGQVIESRHPRFTPGDLVQGVLGWQDYAAASSGGPMPISRIPSEFPMTLPLHALGITGLTAYFGVLDLGRPQAGETVVVSAAAGATGSVAGQVARLQGCRVIGIAGGAEKCDWVTQEAGFDAAIDYKSEDVRGRLRELCPDGIHIYFDNVGGEILDAALTLIASGARIVLCGGISSYNEETPPPGPRNYLNMIAQHARMEGFLVFDYLPRFREALQQLGDWIRRGELAYREDIQHGFENAPRTFLRLFEGKNIGKQLLKIADPPL